VDTIASPQLICLMGAECTGKTTLTQVLAAHLGCPWVPEYLRDFCDEQGRIPVQSEQAQIMRSQFEREQQVLGQAPSGCAYVLCDTAPLLTAVYSAHYFSDHSLLECAHVLHQRYALTLLLDSDLEWVADGIQRDSATARRAVHTLIQHELQARRHPVIEIGGVGDARLRAAIDAVDTLLS
jgi:nicotinamide riboside kinase